MASRICAVLLRVIAAPLISSAAASAQDAPSIRYDLAQCVAVAISNQPAIDVQRRAAQIAAEQVAIARSFYFPQVGANARYTALDEPRSVDINNAYPPAVADVFSDAAAYFQIARAGGAAAADFALDNPTTPLPPSGATFNSIKQQAAASLPTTINVGLLGENSLQSQIAGVQPLWTGGKIEAQVERAEIGQRASELQVTRTEQLTRFHVAQAYYSILLVLDQYRVVERAERHAKNTGRLAQSLYDEGDTSITSVDTLRASTFQNLYGEQRVGLARSYERAYAALKLAMGFEQSFDFMIVDRGLGFSPVEFSSDEVIAAALARRPEIVQARLGMQAAAWQRRGAQAEYAPDVVAFASFSTISDDASFPNPNDSEEWSAGVGASLPLFVGGRRTAQVRQAHFTQAQARDRYNQARQFVTQEAQDAYLEYREMLERSQAALEAANDAEQALSDLNRRYQSNLGADLDFSKHFEDELTTSFLTVASWTRYYQALYGHQLALARLQLVTAADEPYGTTPSEAILRPRADSDDSDAME
jgi:outer membrane protein TolC